MLSNHSPRRRAVARPLTVALACALPAALAPVAQAAPHPAGRPTAQMAIAGPNASIVSGSISFAARHVGPGVRKVIFSIDGGHRWTVRRAPYRYRRTGLLNTRRLRNGVHVLTVKAVFPHHRVRVARQRVMVHNRTAGANATAPTASVTPKPPAGPLDAGVLLPPGGGLVGAPVTLFNRETFKYTSALSTTAETSRYQVMALQYTDAALVPALKAANPNLKILLYQDITLGRVSDPLGWSVCTGYPEDQANHTDWSVKDQNGNPIPDKSYPGNFIMDVGNPAYQQSCIAHAIALTKQAGFDGLYLDDVTANLAWMLPAGVSSPTYPSAAPWQAAMYSMLTNAAAQAHANGLLAMGNIGGAYGTPGLWAKWNAPLDGAEEQAWNDPSEPKNQQTAEWPAKLAEAAWSEANGKYLLLGSYDTSERGNTFGLASMLLVAGGKSSYSTSNANLTSDEAWYPEYDAALRLGAPAGGYRQLSNGVYERVFANGIVLVNPSRQATQTFALGGARFTGSGLTGASAATMAAKSGLILLRAG